MAIITGDGWSDVWEHERVGCVMWCGVMRCDYAMRYAGMGCITHLATDVHLL